MMPTRWVLAAIALLGALAGAAHAVERFPPPDFETGYALPVLDQPAPRSQALSGWSVAALAAALAASAWLTCHRRSRRGVVALSVVSLAYFGFYRGGCVCPVGSLQNVARALADPSFVLPVAVLAMFALPLLSALFYGRVFCAGVCPLGAIQDLTLLWPVRLPRWLERALGVAPFLYLGVAVALAVTGSAFVVCRFDPFVGFFRLSGSAVMLAVGGGLLMVGTVIGRPYCRFLCPYGALLNLFSRVARRRVSITPDDCVICGLCENACPFDAIHEATEEEGTRP